jgi:endonuclease/exonuclease/phosphatase family metal-dependent hydrolase
MRVVTWNCRKASAQSGVWDYLLELAPDLALLQEVCGIPKHVESRYTAVQHFPVRKNGLLQQFTTTILVRGAFGNRIMLQGPAPWVDDELQRFAGNLVSVELHPDHGPRLRVVCVYSPAWPVDKKRLVGVDVMAVCLRHNRDVWVGDLLWAALARNPPPPSDPWIIGGDFNLCETFDAWRGGPRGNREYLDRMDQLGLVDCLRYAQGALTPTFRTLRKGTITAQIDYLFVTDTLRARLVTCDTGSRQRVFEQGLSDHLPIIADFTCEETMRVAAPPSV